ncbi:hypothetical protein [Streptomyces mutabilis]|uniref:hypothetical protein n=1 Tax=Streptomyces mutabilis TaxID=67332 RepID=UPI001F40BD60|nr:hypothetical protein [Streptomyces mutabilis]
MPEVHERGQEPVDEHQPVLRTRAHSALPRTGRKLGLVPLMPQRTQLCHQFSNHVGRQARDPSVADDRCTRRVPHHTTMIDDQKLDVSPLTVHELVSDLFGLTEPFEYRELRHRLANYGHLEGRAAGVTTRSRDGKRTDPLNETDLRKGGTHRASTAFQTSFRLPPPHGVKR